MVAVEVVRWSSAVPSSFFLSILVPELVSSEIPSERICFLGLRFEKRRVQDELEALNSKLTRLRSHHEAGPAVERLQEEIKEYKAILKCSVCHDRPKEVRISLSFQNAKSCVQGNCVVSLAG